jgi:transposase-like protein
MPDPLSATRLRGRRILVVEDEYMMAGCCQFNSGMSVIAHAVWLYFRFPLSSRLVEEMLLERGIVVSYETVRRWAMKFEPAYARRLRRKAPSRRDV